MNEVKGKSALALSRDLGVQYKTAFVLAHKLREAMASELKGMKVGGPGATVEVDGGYFGGYIKPANHKELHRDRRLAKNQNGKRQVVVVIRERDGRTVPTVFKTEAASLNFIMNRVDQGASIMADEAPSWNDLHARFGVSRIDHSKLYSTETGVYPNGAEEFFSRMRRAEIGHHHHIAGQYLIRYAQESAWREDHRRMDNGSQVKTVAGLGDGGSGECGLVWVLATGTAEGLVEKLLRKAGLTDHRGKIPFRNVLPCLREIYSDSLNFAIYFALVLAMRCRSLPNSDKSFCF